MAVKKPILIFVVLAAFAAQATIACLVQTLQHPSSSMTVVNGFAPTPTVPGRIAAGYEVTGAAGIAPSERFSPPEFQADTNSNPAAFETTGFGGFNARPTNDVQAVQPKLNGYSQGDIELAQQEYAFEQSSVQMPTFQPTEEFSESSLQPLASLSAPPSQASVMQSARALSESSLQPLASLSTPPSQANVMQPARALSESTWQPLASLSTPPSQSRVTLPPEPMAVELDSPPMPVVNQRASIAYQEVPHRTPISKQIAAVGYQGAANNGFSHVQSAVASGVEQNAIELAPMSTVFEQAPVQLQQLPTQFEQPPIQLPASQSVSEVVEAWNPPATQPVFPSQVTVTPKPGHNETVNITRDLSLSPPPQPGIALNDYLPNQPPIFTPTHSLPTYDPNVGHRRPNPINRVNTYPIDDGEKFSFETKKREFPPFNEIIAQGRFFYNAELLWAEPNFQGNTAFTSNSANLSESVAFDFDSDFQPRFRFGFESQYGPGIEFTYFNLNSNSELASFTSDGLTTGQTSAFTIGQNIPSSIFADAAGDVLTSQHSIDIDSGTVSFFKELKFPVSRVNGNLGFQYVSIEQQLNSNVVSAGGATVETLNSTTDMRAWGPRAIIEYYRPVGHTPLEFVTSFGGSVLFGQRDQLITNSETGFESRLGADEFLTIIDFFVALQYSKTIGENRSVHGRFGFINQTWIGGGTATFPQGDFGLRGLTFGIGYNR